MQEQLSHAAPTSLLSTVATSGEQQSGRHLERVSSLKLNRVTLGTSPARGSDPGARKGLVSWRSDEPVCQSGLFSFRSSENSFLYFGSKNSLDNRWKLFIKSTVLMGDGRDGQLDRSEQNRNVAPSGVEPGDGRPTGVKPDPLEVMSNLQLTEATLASEPRGGKPVRTRVQDPDSQSSPAPGPSWSQQVCW